MYYTILHTWIIMDFNTFIMLHTWIQMDRETLYYALYLDSNGLRYIILYSVHGLEWTAIYYSMLHTWTRMDCEWTTIHYIILRTCTRMDCVTLYYATYIDSNGLRYILLCSIHGLQWTPMYYVILVHGLLWTSIYYIMRHTLTLMDFDKHNAYIHMYIYMYLYYTIIYGICNVTLIIFFFYAKIHYKIFLC